MKKNLLLIHGTWQTDEFWNEAIPEFERLGYTVHAPVLRYHDLPLMEGAEKIASLSLLDYTQDLVDFAETLDTPPLIIGHSNETSWYRRGLPCATSRNFCLVPKSSTNFLILFYAVASLGKTNDANLGKIQICGCESSTRE